MKRKFLIICFQALASLFIVTIDDAFSQEYNWEQINNGLLDSEKFLSDFAFNLADHIFTCSFYGEGFFRSTNDGDSWMTINSGLPSTIKYGEIEVSKDGTLFCGGWAGKASDPEPGFGIYKSTDNGNTWTKTQITKGTTHAIGINTQGHIFVGMNHNELGGLHRSTDNGEIWWRMGKMFYPTEIEINNNGDIYVGTYQNGLYRSTDGGEHFELLNSSLITIYGITFNSDGDVFVSTTDNGVFRSVDNGISWNTVNSGLPSLNTRKLVANSKSEIFVAIVGEGVFMTSNNGDSWNPVNKGLSNKQVYNIGVNSKDYLFAATEGGGIFRAIKSIDSDDPIITYNYTTDLGTVVISWDIIEENFDQENSWLEFNNSKQSIAKSGTKTFQNLNNGAYQLELYSEDIYGNSSSVNTVISITGVRLEYRGMDIIKIAPNPIIDRLKLEGFGQDAGTIELFSLNGIKLKQIEIEDRNSFLDVSYLEKGVYFITIRSKDFVTTRKIIKL